MASEFFPGIYLKITVHDILINGHGCNPKQNTTNCDVIPLSTYYMQYNKSYRFRLINSQTYGCPLEFTGHNLTVIATDGYPVKPVTFDAFLMLSGERYDVVVHANNDRNKKEAYIRVRALNKCALNKLQVFGRIIFVEDQLKVEKFISHVRPYTDQLDYHVPFKQNAVYLNHPTLNCRIGNHLCVADLKQKGVRGPSGGNMREVRPNREIPIRFFPKRLKFQPSLLFLRDEATDMVVNGAAANDMNKIIMTGTPVPGLTQDDSFVPYCNESTLANETAIEGMHFCPHLIQLKLGEVVDFLLSDVTYELEDIHSFHFHGYGFQIIDMGTLEQYKTNTTPYYNDTHPPTVKDTIGVPIGGFVRIRFRASNPGYWMFHCHFEIHMYTGMRLIVRVGDKSQMRSAPVGFPSCSDYLPPVIGM